MPSTVADESAVPGERAISNQPEQTPPRGAGADHPDPKGSRPPGEASERAVAPEQPPQLRDVSPAAKACAAWFRQLARALKTARLYRPDNPLVLSVREATTEALIQQVRARDGWELSFTPAEILLGDEQVVGSAPVKPGREDALVPPETRLPFIFYRDGIRKMTIMRSLPRGEALEFFNALTAGCNEKLLSDDLVTLLWQANLAHVRVAAAPLEQTFYLSNSAVEAPDEQSVRGTRALGNAVSGTEVRATLGQAAGVQGLHRDTFDDWPLPAAATDVRGGFDALLSKVHGSRQKVLDQWRREKDGDWDAQVPGLFRGLLAMDPGETTHTALACASTTWLTSMLEQHHLARAGRALAMLIELDPERARAGELLRQGLEQVNPNELTEFLDEADPGEHGRFAALMVRIGEPAVPVAFEVMARATRSRVRAAAATALCYLCAEQPKLLVGYLDDPRADVVIHLVFVLGQIGGEGVIGMLRIAARHADPRVRRQAVLSMGGVPETVRKSVLLDELARLDPHILSASLSLLARQKDESVTRFILGLIQEPEFESRSEDVQRALFTALADVADDGVVVMLEKLLHRGHGWLTRRTFTQFAAALTLRRIDTPAARAVLDKGLNSRNGAVRSACTDAMQAKAA